MVWSIGFLANATYTVGMEILNEHGKKVAPGDTFQLEYVDQTPDWPGVGGNFKTGNPNLGRAIKPEGIYPQLVWKGRKGQVPETMEGFGRFFVNDRFRELVERFEPGKHQFFSIEALYKDRSHAQHMYLLNICSRLQALDLDATTAEITRSGMLQPGTGEFCFSEEKVGDHHLWHDRNIYSGTYVSNRFHDAIIEAEFKSIVMIKAPSTGVPR